MLSNWARSFPNCEPIGHVLRAKFPERWVRFHSLPESKRYPEDEAEYATVLQRHNRILGNLAHNGETIVLLTTSYSANLTPVRSESEVSELDPQATPWRTVAMHQIDKDFSERSYWHVFASERCWTPSLFDHLVRRIADDVIANVMMVAVDCRWLMHPYDGGMDVILASSAVRDRFKAEFSDWLSARSDGL